MKWIYFSCALCALPLLNANADNLIGGRLNPITRPLTPLRRELDRSIEQLPLKNDVVDTTHNLVEAVPKRLKIVGVDGQTVMVEVRVENGYRAIEHEWLITVSDEQRPLLLAIPMQIVAENRLAELQLTVIRFRVSAELDSYPALRQRLPTELHDALDRNHVFIAQSAASSETPIAVNATTKNSSICDAAVTVGMIDTAVQQQHPAFADAKLQQQSFIDPQLQAPLAHGTAVASLLVGHFDALQPLLKQAALFNAAVFYPRKNATQGATTLSLIQGLEWLLQQQVAVINMSLAGPDNKLLALAIARAQQRGAIIVAAAGNEGPTAPPRYPAAYPDVIAVTAVNSNQKNYRWANRGAHIAFAAQGVEVLTADSSNKLATTSGTSMAAPVVSAWVACARQNERSAADVMQYLITHSIDLGEPGRDEIFGYGELRR